MAGSKDRCVTVISHHMEKVTAQQLNSNKFQEVAHLDTAVHHTYFVLLNPCYAKTQQWKAMLFSHSICRFPEAVPPLPAQSGESLAEFAAEGILATRMSWLITNTMFLHCFHMSSHTGMTECFIAFQTNYVIVPCWTQSSSTVLREAWLERAWTRGTRNCVQVPHNQDCHPISHMVKDTVGTMIDALVKKNPKTSITYRITFQMT